MRALMTLEGIGVVTAIGAATEFGQIAVLTGSVAEKVTQLHLALSRLGPQLGLAAVLIAIAIVASAWWRDVGRSRC